MISNIRRRYIITGQVQGVGFRPFVYRTAAAAGVSGNVRNDVEGVVIEIQGPPDSVAQFGDHLQNDLPPLAKVVTFQAEDIAALDGEAGFEILISTGGEGHNVLISPDVATCPDCLADMNDPQNRRFDYAFTNCTNCGPRYTITRSIPYDRPKTSMACFKLCTKCQQEYEDPMDRRFHAQPNACPVCGPKMWLTDKDGVFMAQGSDSISSLARELAKGSIAAVKGLGGFHLVCNAADPVAVKELRRRKNRPDKPLAVMVRDMESARALADISPDEEAWLTGSVRPIVLCHKQTYNALAPSIAPDTNFIGLMLPYTPLHHVLMKEFDDAVTQGVPALVMTSGNMSSEPIALGNREAQARLGEIADIFFFHNRDILIRNDDSVIRMDPFTSQPIFMRRARGFAPSPVFLAQTGPTVLGCGPELKCTMTLTKGNQAFTSQHIGNMSNLENLEFYKEILAHLQDILRIRPQLIVRDLHPDYMTSTLAEELGREWDVPVMPLQHHYAHIHAVLAEHKIMEPVIGLALDGTGYGEDGTIWGGECLFVDPEGLEHQRLGHLTHIRLPGGEAAVREPWRIAQAMLHDLGITEPGDLAWPWLEQHREASRMLPQIIEKGINSPLTSSCGRLFDGVAALCGLANAITYEGQAAIRLERTQDMSVGTGYPCPMITADPVALDTTFLIRAVVEDLAAGAPVGVVARKFHLGLIEGLAEMAASFSTLLGCEQVALSGGVMQNLTMATELPLALQMQGLTPVVHIQLPPNDGCISLGQAVWGLHGLVKDF